jgi:hypothetical protein
MNAHPRTVKTLFTKQMQGAHVHGAHSDHAAMTRSATVLADLAAVKLHTLPLFGVMAVIAMVVYEKLGVLILRYSSAPGLTSISCGQAH